MSQTETLENKIDDLLRSLGGLERLRELARLSSLDHLVNLHLLSHLTKLDKIEGLDKLKELDQLKNLERLADLKVITKLDQLAQLTELRNLEHLSQLTKLTELQELRSLQDLKHLEALSQLDKLEELRRLDALGSLQNLSGLEKLDHLKYLANLDELNGLVEFLEKHGDKFAKLRHLESLDNLHLLDQLKKLDKLDRLDELSRLDVLKSIEQLAEAPPALPQTPLVEKVVIAKRTLTDYALVIVFDFARTVTVAAILILVLLLPQGKKATEEAAAFLGFGQGAQVNWALQILLQASGESFPKYWTDFQKRLQEDSLLVFDTRAPWSMKHRYEKLQDILSYDFNYKGQSLRERVRSDVEQRLSKFEGDWKESLSLEIGQVMLRQGENQKLILLNQLKDLAVGGRWYDVIKVSASAPQDRFTQEAAIVALVHLQLSDPSKLADIMKNSP